MSKSKKPSNVDGVLYNWFSKLNVNDTKSTRHVGSSGKLVKDSTPGGLHKNITTYFGNTTYETLSTGGPVD